MLDRFNPVIDELGPSRTTTGREPRGRRSFDDTTGGGSGNRTGLCPDPRPVARFPRGKHVVSYLGLNPKERSSGDKQHTYSISKQGNTMMRWLLVEAAQTAVRYDPELLRLYQD